MAKTRYQKARKTATGEWLYCNFSARPEEIQKWKSLAQADRRSLSFWIRDALNRRVEELERIDELLTGGTKAVDVAPVSPDRA